ncbi:uncharacterized protein LOC108102161 isoform X2 [Drosophila ficusphila]|uniref:uncharacterized protein LOC108102161 isoform X2 n=1 Tax=Drosophila ficusphila TaxID=30025 RepID=UPI001C8A3C6D|nr:uncharacterized protein LOC108102161 isoform X2 [Drosophila ficusphila]
MVGPRQVRHLVRKEKEDLAKRLKLAENPIEEKFDFAEPDQPSVSHSAENRIISLLKEFTYLREQNASLHHKVDILAEKLAETTALLKVKLKADENVERSGVSFPLRSEQDIELFESSITPELWECYVKKKIIKVAKKETFVKAIRLVLDDSLIQNYNLDGTSGKKSLKSFSILYNILKEVSETAFPFDEPDKAIRKAIHNIKNSFFKKKKRISVKLNNTL